MTFRVPASELTTEQILSRLRTLLEVRNEIGPDDWSGDDYPDEFAEAFAELDRRLSGNDVLPQAWRWARTPV